MSTLKFKEFPKDHPFFIAEIGKNFIVTEQDQTTEQYLENAKRLIDAAVNSGAHAVKFQTHEVEDEQYAVSVTSPHFPLKDRYSWVARNTEATPLAFWNELSSYAKKKGILFFSTPMSRKAAKKLADIDVPFWKVGSGDVQDFVLLDYLISTKKPIIISTGMTSLAELDRTVQYILSRGSELAILYCISKYPAPPEDFNLQTISYLQERYPSVIVGFSDHSLGDDTIVATAVSLGARIIEKHFTLDRTYWGSDHKVSLTPTEFRAMVNYVNGKQVSDPAYYGLREKELDGAKNEFRPYFHKSLVAGRDIEKGEIISMDDVYAMRPHSILRGIPSHGIHRVVGKSAPRSFRKYDVILEDYFL